MSKSIAIKQGYVLAYHFQALVILFFGSGIITTVFAHPTWLVVIAVITISLIPMLLVLGRYLIILDADKQQIKRLIRILGFSLRLKHYEFHQVERLFLNRVQTSQRLASYVSQREFKDVIFKTFVKFHGGEKWLLEESHDYNDLRTRTLGYQQLIWAPFFDNFSNEVIQ